MKKMNQKFSYLLILLGAQNAFSVSDSYLKEMTDLETEWNDYAPMSQKVLDLDTLTSVVETAGEGFAQEKFKSATRSDRTKYLTAEIKELESKLSFQDANANVNPANYVADITTLEKNRFALLSLYVEEVKHLTELNNRFENQNSIGILSAQEASLQASYTHRITQLKIAFASMKAKSATKNPAYQANSVLEVTQKNALTQIATEIAALTI